MRQATAADLPQLMSLMQAFYAEAGLPLAPEQVGPPLAALLANAQLGTMWLLEASGQPMGYLALTWCFSLEYGGRRAVLDDFLCWSRTEAPASVRPHWRLCPTFANATVPGPLA